MFTLSFRTDNAAFAEDFPGLEAARILTEIAWQLRNGATEGHARDANGNRVGDFALTPEA
jgi:hypothetical protein